MSAPKHSPQEIKTCGQTSIYAALAISGIKQANKMPTNRGYRLKKQLKQAMASLG